MVPEGIADPEAVDAAINEAGTLHAESENPQERLRGEVFDALKDPESADTDLMIIQSTQWFNLHVR